MARNNLNTEANITASGAVHAREVDFVNRFTDNWNALRTILGIMRPIRKQPGTKLVGYKVTVPVLATSPGEGEDTQLSKPVYTPINYTDLNVERYESGVTIEAVAKYGATVAIERADDAFLTKLQKTVMTRFYNFLQTGQLESTAATFQAGIAKAIGSVVNHFQSVDKDITDIVTFVNTVDAYDYLGAANITIQNVFGIQYIKDFMGASVIILSDKIPQGTIIATPVENIDLYYIDPSDDDLSKLGLEYTVAGETNLIGFHAEGNYRGGYGSIFALMGMCLFAEDITGISKVMINPFNGPTVSATNGSETMFGHTVSDLQTDVAVNGNAITGTLKYVDSGSLADVWGAGNFIALDFTASASDTDATTYRVGLNPSVGSGLVALDADMNGAFQITDPTTQVLVVETSNANRTRVTTQTYDLSGLTLETE